MVKLYTGHTVISILQFDMIDKINTKWMKEYTYKNIFWLYHKHKDLGMKFLRVGGNILASRASPSLLQWRSSGGKSAMGRSNRYFTNILLTVGSNGTLEMIIFKWIILFIK